MGYQGLHPDYYLCEIPSDGPVERKSGKGTGGYRPRSRVTPVPDSNLVGFRPGGNQTLTDDTDSYPTILTTRKLGPEGPETWDSTRDRTETKRPHLHGLQ